MAHAPTQPLAQPGSYPAAKDAAEVDLLGALPLLRIGICLAAMLALPCSVLLMVRYAAPTRLPQRLAGLGYAREIQARVDGAVDHYHRGRVSAGEYLCPIIGFSGGQEGIDIEQLAREDDVSVRYLGLCGACDGTLRGLTRLSSPLYQSELRPDLVILAMNPFHMVVRPFQPSLRRADIKYGIDVQLGKLRREILRMFGAPVDPRHVREDPWRGMVKNYFEPVPEWVLLLRIEQYGKRGYFDPSKYENAQEQLEYLHALIRQSRRRGAEMLIVLMPVHPLLYERIPEAATPLLKCSLSQAFEDCPPILDYQQAMDGGAFHDVSHLNGEGRARFTSILARDVARHLPSKSPRMRD